MAHFRAFTRESGYGLMAVVALDRSSWAWPSLALFVVAYALANVAAFAVVVALHGRTSIDAYRGLARPRPWHAAALTVALLSLVGIPPLVGFTAKLELFAATLEAGYGWLAVLAVINRVISASYYLRVIPPMYLEPPEGEVALLGTPLRWPSPRSRSWPPVSASSSSSMGST